MSEIKLSQLNDINSLSFMRDLMDPLSHEWQEVEMRIREILAEKYKDEEVYCIDSSVLPPSIKPGFVPFNDHTELFKTIEDMGSFIKRSKVEYNPAFKQIIPYIVGLSDTGQVFVMKRTAGDARLVGQLSLGIGGHIDSFDRGSNSVIFAGLLRELHEEVDVLEDDIEGVYFKGTIYDPSNMVGKDHLGLVFLMKMKNSNLKIKEEESLKGGFYSIEKLKENDELVFETWSKIVLDNVL